MQGWIDKSDENTAGRLVEFTRCFEIEALPSEALLHFSADTRYKLLVNGRRVAVGPARGSSAIWYYDSLDIAPFLSKGKNVIKFVVLRYYAAGRAAMPFARTAFPGLTVLGEVSDSPNAVDLSSTCDGWSARKLEGVSFPTGLIDDVFLHVSLNPNLRIPKSDRYVCRSMSVELFLPLDLTRSWCHTTSRR